jgi:hypothetical protein
MARYARKRKEGGSDSRAKPENLNHFPFFFASVASHKVVVKGILPVSNRISIVHSFLICYFFM